MNSFPTELILHKYNRKETARSYWSNETSVMDCVASLCSALICYWPAALFAPTCSSPIGCSGPLPYMVKDISQSSPLHVLNKNSRSSKRRNKLKVSPRTSSSLTDGRLPRGSVKVNHIFSSLWGRNTAPPARLRLVSTPS